MNKHVFIDLNFCITVSSFFHLHAHGLLIYNQFSTFFHLNISLLFDNNCANMFMDLNSISKLIKFILSQKS
jgi:hypothetical protein